MKSTNDVQRDRFIAFIEKYEIKGRVAAYILGLHQSTVALKKCGCYSTTEEDVNKLKLGYYLFLSEKITRLEKELAREGISTVAKK
jgi:hypothetical protein